MGTALACGMSAEVVLPQFFTDNMVVQQKSVLTVPGTARPGAKVSVRTDWDGGAASAVADKNGKFQLSLPTPAEPGGPYTMIFSDGSEKDLVLSNVLSGEVWLCSGQSNMEMPIKGWGEVINVDEVVGTAQHPDIRLLQIRKGTAYAPQDDAPVNMGGWVEASPGTMDFSAIAYLFALQLHNELGVPVGVIDSSWGGTFAEAWTGYDYLSTVNGFEDELAALKKSKFDKEALQKDYEEREAKWWQDLNDSAVPTFDYAKYQTGKDWGKMPVPGPWEDSVLPGFDGIVWLQYRLNLPKEAAGKPLELHMCAIDDYDKTYFNGEQVGMTDNWMAPRSYMVPGNLVKAGENVITVAAIDFSSTGGFYGDPADMYVSAGGKTYSIAGEWSYKAGKNLSDMARRPQPVDGPHFPNVLYNAMIHPLKVMPVKGVLWYQGCNNVGRAEQYEPLFQALIKDWRHLWREDMPFYFVQLAGYLRPVNVQPDSQWAMLRNSQAKALSLPNTGMAVAIDLGNPIDIHPTDKQEVARRLSLIALNRDYGKDCEYAAPVCVNSKAENGKMVIKFNGAVKPTSTALTGFIIGDAEGNFAYANARLQGDDTVVLSSPLIAAPTVVRYDWADYPGGNLYGANGLPVAPFATDK